MSDAPITLEVEQQGEVVVAHLSGELDLAVAPGAGRDIEAAVPTSATGLVVDCLGLGFIDSSGVAMLFTLARQLGNRRQVLRVVVEPGGPVDRVLELVEFARAAAVDRDLGSAVAAARDGA